MTKARLRLTSGAVLVASAAVLAAACTVPQGVDVVEVGVDNARAAPEGIVVPSNTPSASTINAPVSLRGSGANAFTASSVQGVYMAATLHSVQSGGNFTLPIPSTLAGLTARVYWDAAASTPTSVYSSVNLATASDHSDVYAGGARVASAHYVPGGTIYADVPITAGAHTTTTLSVTTGGATYSSTSIDVFEMKVSPFILLADTFHSDRCTTCHSLGSSQAISDLHVARGAWAAPRPAAQPDSAAQCNSCHAPAVGNDVWRSPSFAKGMNFKGMTTNQICQAVTNHMGPDELQTHMGSDLRVRWALQSGALPNGTDRPTAPPYSSVQAWLLAGEVRDQWVATANPCDSLVWFP